MMVLTCTPKLAKLIPLLASDKDGEVVAAARAIGRALQSVGADFHDLAKVVTTPATRSAEPELGFPTILKILHGHPALSDWERGFMESIMLRQSYRKPLTERQRDTVFRIWERLQ